MIGVINYGSGNYRSLCNALDFIGIKYVEIKSAKDFIDIEKIILPGVGAYGDCIKRLSEINILDPLREIIINKKKLFLGICVGMQILSDFGFEFDKFGGLGLIKGNVKKFTKTSENSIPHIGWSRLTFSKQSILFRDIDESSYFYFVHSYYFDVHDYKYVSSYANNGIKFPSSVESDNILGVQFHPEKSQKDGLKLLNNFSLL